MRVCRVRLVERVSFYALACPSTAAERPPERVQARVVVVVVGSVERVKVGVRGGRRVAGAVERVLLSQPEQRSHPNSSRR